MKVYLIDAETNETIRIFENVKSWGSDFVIFDNSGYLGKIYASENEYFTDEEPLVEENNN